MKRKHIKSILHFIRESEGEEKTYLFNQLPPDIQEKVLDKNRYMEVDFDGWYAGVFEDFYAKMEELGIGETTNPEIRFSGFYSQGDGASFTSKDIDTVKFLERVVGMTKNPFIRLSEETEKSEDDDELEILMKDLIKVGFEDIKKLDPEQITIEIRRTDSRHVHYNSVVMDIDVEYNDWWDDPETEKKFDEFFFPYEKKAEEWLKDTCKELYSDLEKEYENLTSDEVIKSSLIDNDTRFDGEGNIV